MKDLTENAHSCKEALESAAGSLNADVGDLLDLARLFKVFGDGTRIRILTLLMDGELCVYHISEALQMEQSAVSHQLGILRSAGLVRPRREGKTVYYSLDDEHIREIVSAGLTHILHRKGELT